MSVNNDVSLLQICRGDEFAPVREDARCRGARKKKESADAENADVVQALQQKKQKNIVSDSGAAAALARLLHSTVSSSSCGLRTGHQPLPSLREVTEMDPVVLSMAMSKLVMSVDGNAASQLCKQMERATDVQTSLRDRQVKEYQEQINKSVEQAEKVKKAGIVKDIFDWVVGGAELLTGVFKMIEGVLTGNVLDAVDGMAYVAAGMAGLVKATAETVELLGGDKASCDAIIKRAGVVQNTLEGVAMVMDILHLGMAVSSARALSRTVVDVLTPEVMETLTDAVMKGAEHKLESMAQWVGERVSEVMGKSAGVIVENELIELGDIAIETAGRTFESEADMMLKMGKSFTFSGVELLVKDAVKAAAKSLANRAEVVTEQVLKDAIMKQFRRRLAKTILMDAGNVGLATVRASAAGVTKISTGVVAVQSASLLRDVERLIQSQAFCDFMMNQAEDNKKSQHKRLEDVSREGGEVLKSTLKTIDSYGSALARLADSRA